MEEIKSYVNSSKLGGKAEGKTPTVVLCIGMAGAGKTTVMQRLAGALHAAGNKGYLINLDPAVVSVPYGPNIDIRDTVDYKAVMKQYGLGPNGAILTSLNLFATKFDQVLQLMSSRAADVDYFLVDTPGQIEAFTWSASGSIITEALANSFPTVLAYIADTPRSLAPQTFMSNMLYASSILYKTRLPFVLVWNKTDVADAKKPLTWMSDFEAFQTALDSEHTYASDLTRSLSLVLDEFYRTLDPVPMSAVTGTGVPAFWTAVDAAVVKYHEEYVPAMQARKAAREAQEAKRQAISLQKLSLDSKK